jgi:hypothetical protein
VRWQLRAGAVQGYAHLRAHEESDMVVRRLLFALSLVLGLLCGSAQAGVPLVGWGYSAGNLVWGILPWGPEGAGIWIHPRARSSLGN